MVTVVSDVALPTWLDPKVTLEGLAVIPAPPGLELESDEPLVGLELSEGSGLPLSVVPPAVEVGLSDPAVLVTPGVGPCDALFLFVCLLPTPSSRGISTPRPVTMAATPEMIPGTVVQKFLFSAAMRHLLSHPDRGDRVGVVQRSPQRKLRAPGGQSARSAQGASRHPDYLPRARRSTPPAGHQGSAAAK